MGVKGENIGECGVALLLKVLNADSLHRPLLSPRPASTWTPLEVSGQM